MTFLEKLFSNPIYLLIAYLLIINIVSFAMMGIDKHKAVKGKRRISERALFISVILGGSLGGIYGIYAFRHKTLRKKFTIGFPLILVLQVAIFVFIYMKTRA